MSNAALYFGNGLIRRTFDDCAQWIPQEVFDHSTGWGSVSDQNGVNTAFRTLNLPYRYTRAGGARIEKTT